jgi:hypothetical protein
MRLRLVMPNFRDKKALITIALGLVLILGCVAVWLDADKTNNRLSLGLLGILYILSGLSDYADGTEFVFHAAILLIGPFAPLGLLVVGWLALLFILIRHGQSQSTFTEIQGPSSWNPL